MDPTLRLRASLAFLATLLVLVLSDEGSHKYVEGEAVKLYVNKVGPYNNPQETYNYYELPFCKPTAALGHKPKRKWGGLGEVLQGNELIDSELEIQFKKDTKDQRKICSLRLGDKEVEAFTKAVKQNYWYEFFLDDLPAWGFVGEYPEDESQAYIFTHKTFRINYNGNRVVMFNLSADDLKPITPGVDIDFTYSVEWVPTNSLFEHRFERYLDHSFFQHQIHWFSIFNSFMMVIFLTGLVSMILMRTLRNDYAKYTKEEDDIELLEREVTEESGWKLVHGDAFRPPKFLTLLSALVGTGAQLALLTLSVIFLAIVGALYFSRGAILTSFIMCYALTSVIAGYVGGGFYARNGGKNWIQAMMLTASFFPGTCFAIAFLLNTVAIAYRSLAAVPFGTIVIVLFLWSFISFPLTLLGTVVGRNWAGAPDNPCRIKRIPSPIPERKWYLKPWIIALVGGLLPFGSIFIEMYFIFTSFWNYKVYYVYGFMLLVFLILVIVTVCVTIVGTYFLLNAENYHWQWTSFMSGTATSFYVFLYSIHYFVAKTKMTGFFQTCFYFGYTLMCCLGLGIMCGAVGYLGSSQFVKRIYRNIKCD